MPWSLLLLVAAMVLFILAAIPIPGRFNLTAAGLACLAGYFLIARG